ncbi:MAG: hypothetical protein JWP12_2051 [Bacteroidetes bacterium]|nr:hypothetical protein [Bacteroidota bacterium]
MAELLKDVSKLHVGMLHFRLCFSFVPFVVKLHVGMLQTNLMCFFVSYVVEKGRGFCLSGKFTAPLPLSVSHPAFPSVPHA